MKKQKDKKDPQQEVQKPQRTSCLVWKQIQSQNLKSTLDYEWPKFKTDRERIKFMSNHYKNVSIVEAFENEYNFKSKVDVNNIVNDTPQELHVGQIVPMKISSISKNGVVFDNVAFKQNVMSGVNLYKYEKFRHFLPIDPINVKVTSVQKDRVMVDPLTPMLDNWMNNILNDTNIQKNLKQPQTIKVKNLKLTRGGFMGKAVIPTVSSFVGDEYTIDAFIPGSQIVLNIENDFEKWNGKTVDAFVTNYMNKPNDPSQMSLICSAKEYLKFLGDVNIISMFNNWCEDNEQWKTISQQRYTGKVTGIINSSKKCGVFVEIAELSLTGMIPMKPEDLVNYKPQDSINVMIDRFDEDTYYDPISQQVRHNLPYVIENDVLKEVNVKLILKLA
jgi:ribosomal protein S1